MTVYVNNTAAGRKRGFTEMTATNMPVQANARKFRMVENGQFDFLMQKELRLGNECLRKITDLVEDIQGFKLKIDSKPKHKPFKLQASETLLAIKCMHKIVSLFESAQHYQRLTDMANMEATYEPKEMAAIFLIAGAYLQNAPRIRPRQEIARMPKQEPLD